MFKPFLLLSAVVLFEIACTPVPAHAQQRHSSPATAAKSAANAALESQARAKALYGIDCAVCHGDNGDGKTDVAKEQSMTLDDWTDSKTLAGKADKDLFDVIRNGKGKMPSEPVGRATDTEVRNLIIYIRSLGKEQPATPPATPTTPATPAATTPPAPSL